MIEHAKAIIEEAFRDKLDKSGKPYTGHLYRVCQAMAESGGDEELQCIALLHDLLEDCPEWDAGGLREHFSERVVDGVVAMTHSDDEDYFVYVDRVKTNADAVTVKLADLRDNMDMTRLMTVTERDLERREKYRKAWKLLTGQEFR